MVNKYKIIIKSTIGSFCIVAEILFGIFLVQSGMNIFFGYFNYLFGSAIVYFLCYNYFKNNALSTKEETQGEKS